MPMDAQQVLSSLYLSYTGHATVLIEMDGIRLLTDPLLRSRVGLLRRKGTVPDLALYQNVDAVLISHIHPDHLDLLSLRLLARGTQLIVPRGAGKVLLQRKFQNVTELRAGETVELGPSQITATYAKHHAFGHRFGPNTDCLGFIISGSYEVYFAGDTGLFPEMAKLAENLDVALLPVWGWGPRLRGHHLTPYEAAQAVALLRPRLAVPIHWGTFYPLGMGWMRTQFLTRPPHDFARHVARLAPQVEVRVVPPGGTLQWGRDSESIG